MDRDTVLPAPAGPAMATGARDYYSIGQAAELLGVSRVSIWRWIRAGHLPAARLGHRTIRISCHDLARLLGEGGTSGPRALAVQGRGAEAGTTDDAEAAPRADWRAVGASEGACEDDRLRAITVLQQQARSLEAALAAEEASRVAAEAALRVRDEFLSIAAHELRTPITSLSGQAQLLLRRLRRDAKLAPEQVARGVETIRGQADRLTRLVSRLLDLAQLEGGKLELERHPTDLAGLVEQVVAGARAWSERHPISVAAPPSLEARVDPVRLEQVLTNLLDNAVKYSPEGGPVEVVLARVGADTVELSVRDHGLGIPAEKRERLFERFYRAHSDGNGHRSGMGLGLYVSRQIAQLHGGDIRPEFPPEAGTRFVVRLPIALDEAEFAGTAAGSVGV